MDTWLSLIGSVSLIFKKINNLAARKCWNLSLIVQLKEMISKIDYGEGIHMLTASGPANMDSLSILIEKMTQPLTSRAQTRVKGEEWKNKFSAGKGSKHFSHVTNTLFFPRDLSLSYNKHETSLPLIYFLFSLASEWFTISFFHMQKKKLSSSFITACTLFSSFPQPMTHILIVRFPHHQQHWSPLL